MSRMGWGLIGGGDGSQIGYAHRAAAELDRRLAFRAGALDADPDRARAFAVALGLDPERAYGSWQEMLRAEARHSDPVRLVTVATPNDTHFGIAKAFLEGGFHVLCEKPLTLTVEEATELVAVAARCNRICAVNYGYSGYPLVRQMRAMVAAGDLGRIRVVVAEFAGGFLADAADADNPRVRWRFDPARAGVSAITMDAGIHALHLACYVTGRRITRVSSDYVRGIAGRQLEDDSLTAFRMEGGVAGRLWASGLAIGRAHGLTLQVYGEKGGLCWRQERPDQLGWTPLHAPARQLERGAAGLSPAARRANRITVGHADGLVSAFANVYADLHEVISARDLGAEPDPLATTYPSAEDGLHSIAVVHATAASAGRAGSWVEVD